MRKILSMQVFVCNAQPGVCEHTLLEAKCRQFNEKKKLVSFPEQLKHFNLLSPILIFTVSYKARQKLMLCMNSFSDPQCESQPFQIHVQTKTRFSVA